MYNKKYILKAILGVEGILLFYSGIMLALASNNEIKEMMFLAKVGCKICINVCPEGDNGCSSGSKAIKIFTAKEVKHEIKTLMKDEIIRCRVCGAIVGSRKSLNLVKKIMTERGLECEDEWLERCPTHRAEYSYKKFFGQEVRFRPRRGPNDLGGV
jgi:hypothetical protein